jgi:hypothetical protein
MAEFGRTMCCMRFGCVKTLSRHVADVCRWRWRYDGVLVTSFIPSLASRFSVHWISCRSG